MANRDSLYHYNSPDSPRFLPPFQRWHMCHDVMMPLVGLFSEIADNCLLYLASCPATVTHDDTAAAYLLTNGVHLNFAQPHTGSTQFFTLTAILCAQYAQANASKLISIT